MSYLFKSRRDASRASRPRASRPQVEGLEDRLLQYAASGDHFAFGSRITWSLMPDGTKLGGNTSNLVSVMNQKLGSGTWVNALKEAFAEWENVANVNLVQVGDDGTPFGSGSYQQGSPTYGDIRIGGYFQQGNILALAMLPPGSNGGSDAGDILFNTAQPWRTNGDYDLETVAIHEVGHALGLDHSTNVYAAMYASYGGVQQTLGQDDINGIQAVWGPRQEDAIASSRFNFTSGRAADLTSSINASNQVVLPRMNVADSDESYWFKVSTPATASNNLTVQIQSSGLSELSPKVQLYNASLKGLVQTAASPTTYGATITASISNATPNTTYYVRVMGSNPGASGAGAYALTINMGGAPTNLVAPPNTVVYAQLDQGGGADFDTFGGTGSIVKWLALNGGNRWNSLIDSFLTAMANRSDSSSTTSSSLTATDDSDNLRDQVLQGLLQGATTSSTDPATVFPGSSSPIRGWFSNLESSLSKFLASSGS